MAGVEADIGPIAILVNNAGITRDNLIMKLDEEDWRSVIDTNLGGAFFTCRAVARPMLKRRAGTIINMSSVVGVHGNAGQTNYSASKAGLIGLTKSLAKELGTRGIRVNAIAPGYISTELTDALPEAARAAILESTPLGGWAIRRMSPGRFDSWRLMRRRSLPVTCWRSTEGWEHE